MVGQAHTFLFDVVNIGTLLAFELKCFDTVDFLCPSLSIVVKPIPATKLVSIVIKAKTLIPYADT